jgi:hypothetical protein
VAVVVAPGVPVGPGDGVCASAAALNTSVAAPNVVAAVIHRLFMGYNLLLLRSYDVLCCEAEWSFPEWAEGQDQGLCRGCLRIGLLFAVCCSFGSRPLLSCSILPTGLLSAVSVPDAHYRCIFSCFASRSKRINGPPSFWLQMWLHDILLSNVAKE